MKRAVVVVVAALALALLGARPVRADAPPPAAPGGQVDIEERLGEPVPRALPFVDSAGRAVHFGEYLAGRPVVLALVYHRCLGLCSLLLAGLTRYFRGAGLLLLAALGTMLAVLLRRERRRGPA